MSLRWINSHQANKTLLGTEHEPTIYIFFFYLEEENNIFLNQ